MTGRPLLAGLAVLLLGVNPGSIARTAPAASDLSVFMREQLNPAFTEVSHQLHHRGIPSEDNPELDAAVDRLKMLSNKLSTLNSTSHGDLSSFKIHVVQLQIATRALAESERDQSTMWFNQISAVCSSCHLEYK